MKHKHFVFSLVLIMLLPLGAKHIETIEKGEAERIECVTSSSKQSTSQQIDQHRVEPNKACFPYNSVCSKSNLAAPAQLVRKLYLMQLSLLI